jgi:hypothetical protein
MGDSIMNTASDGILYDYRQPDIPQHLAPILFVNGRTTGLWLERHNDGSVRGERVSPELDIVGGRIHGDGPTLIVAEKQLEMIAEKWRDVAETALRFAEHADRERARVQSKITA